MYKQVGILVVSLVILMPAIMQGGDARGDEHGDGKRGHIVNMHGSALPLTIFAVSSSLSAQGQREVPPKATDRITKEVRHEILMLPYFGVFDNINYSVSGYDVTLMGQVTNPTLKKDAENAVKHIEGVENVVNQIEVLPTSSMDDGLRLTLYRAIYGFPSMEKYAMPVIKPIRIIVKNGHVTLEGVVDSENDKNVANIQANTVSGIFSVTNKLRVVK
jgi:hyperosmotically inducible protein